MKTEIEVCVFCKTPDQDKKTDHLREVYKIAQDKLDSGQYKPRLYSTEMDALQRGSSPVCSNMKKCRSRRN